MFNSLKRPLGLILATTATATAIAGCGSANRQSVSGKKPKSAPLAAPIREDHADTFSLIVNSFGEPQIRERFFTNSNLIVVMSPENHRSNRDFQLKRAELMLKTGSLERYYVEGFVGRPGSKEWKDSVNYHDNLFNVNESRIDRDFDSKIALRKNKERVFDAFFERCPDIKNITFGIETPRSAKINAISAVGDEIFSIMDQLCNAVVGTPNGAAIASEKGTCNVTLIAEKLYLEAQKLGTVGFPKFEIDSFTQDFGPEGKRILITDKDVGTVQLLREQFRQWVRLYAENERTRDWNSIISKDLERNRFKVVMVEGGAHHFLRHPPEANVHAFVDTQTTLADLLGERNVTYITLHEGSN